MRNLQEIEGVTTWRDARKYRSDYGEDMFLINFFKQKTKGYLLDIGAADGVTGSNSFRLLNEFDWGGILVEPNPDHHKNLDLLFTNVNDIDVYKGAISQNHTEVTLSKWGGSYVGHSNIFGKGGSEKIQVPSLGINTLLRLYNAPPVIDFIDLDMEEAEGEVINNFPWDEFTVKLWCIERATAYKLDKVLTEKGYIRLQDNNASIDPANEFWMLDNLNFNNE